MIWETARSHEKGKEEKRKYLTVFQPNAVLDLYVATNNRTLYGATIPNRHVVHNNWINNLQIQTFRTLQFQMRDSSNEFLTSLHVE